MCLPGSALARCIIAANSQAPCLIGSHFGTDTELHDRRLCSQGLPKVSENRDGWVGLSG